jgi:hypothetical protein
MNTILVTDIFGKTAALAEIAANFSHEVEVLDPYNATSDFTTRIYESSLTKF